MKLSLMLAKVAKSSSSTTIQADYSTTKSLLASSRSTANRIFLSAKKMFSITSRYNCLLLLACLTLLSQTRGGYCWNPYEALEYRTFNDPPMDPSLSLAMAQALNPAPMLTSLTGYMSDQPVTPQVFESLPAVTLTNQPAEQETNKQNRPVPEVKSVMSQLASTALEVAQNAAANIAQELASKVVNDVVQTTTPTADSSLMTASSVMDYRKSEQASVNPDTTGNSGNMELVEPANDPKSSAKPLSPAGKILGELVNSKNASERLANVAFQLLRPRKQEASVQKSHAYAEQQIISQHADMFQRQLLQPVKHRDTSGSLLGSESQADGARNSPFSSVLSNFKASKGISSRSSIVRAISDNKLARALSMMGKSITGNKYIAGAAAASVLAALGLTATKFLGPYLMAGSYSKLGEPMLGSGSFMSPVYASPSRQTASFDSMMMSGYSPSNQFFTGYPTSPLTMDSNGDASSFSQQSSSPPIFQRYSLITPSSMSQLSNGNKQADEPITGYYSDYYNQNYHNGLPYSIDSIESFNPSKSTSSRALISLTNTTAEPISNSSDQIESIGTLTSIGNASRRQTSGTTTSRRPGTVIIKLDKATRELLRLDREQDSMRQFSLHKR